MRISPRLRYNRLIIVFILVHSQYTNGWSNDMLSFSRSLTKSVPKVHRLPMTYFSQLFGSKALAGNPPGEIYIEDDQSALKLDINKLEDTVARIRKILGYETYSVSLLLVDDEYMKETNQETRGINEPTDILSFPMLEAVEPGILEDPEFDVPDYYNLGDMLVDVPYVMRRCQEDEQEELHTTDGQTDDENGDSDHTKSVERGVSGAMATVYNPEQRVHMLLVHGMLHLVGHDHEDDDEYELMVAEEERILDLLQLPTGEASSRAS